MVDFLHQAYPAESHRVPVGTPGKYEYKDPGVYGFDSSKSTRELGIKCESVSWWKDIAS